MNNWNQRIELEGCLNLRDVGGYPTKDGKVTRQGVLLRSDSLSRLPETSVQALSERGVRAIVDLRGPWETEAEDPHVFSSLAGVKYTNVPLLLQPEGPRPLTSPP